MKKTLSICLLTSLIFAGCASITTGSSQQISVDTGSITGAKCKLSNTCGTWYIDSTPGSAMIKRSTSELTIQCETPTHVGHKRVESHTKGRALGNLICGGFIGGAVDMSTGSAYEYPNDISVNMIPKTK